MVRVPARPPAPQLIRFGSVVQRSGQCGDRSLPMGRLSLAADHCQKNSPAESSRTSISAMVISCARAGRARAHDASTTSKPRRLLIVRLGGLVPDLVFLGQGVDRGAALLGSGGV